MILYIVREEREQKDVDVSGVMHSLTHSLTYVMSLRFFDAKIGKKKKRRER